MKYSVLNLYSGVPFDKGLDNVLDVSRSTLNTYLETFKAGTYNNFSIILKEKNTIVVGASYQSAIVCNYMSFYNPSYDTTYRYAFIDEVEYLNDNTVKIHYTLDVWNTYSPYLDKQQVFVDREHVSNDTVGANLIPENLDTGDYIKVSVNEIIKFKPSDCYICVVSSQVPDAIQLGAVHLYNGIFSGSVMLMFRTNLDAVNFMRLQSASFKDLSVVSTAFMVPASIFDEDDIYFSSKTITVDGGGTYTFEYGYIKNSLKSHYIDYSGRIDLQRRALKNYTPKNNKLLSSPYCYFYVSNNAGADVTYKYEDFTNNSVGFLLFADITPGMSIRLVPSNYKSISNYAMATDETRYFPCSFNEGISCSKIPVCNIVGDAYTNWLVQNSNNIKENYIGGALKIAGGIAGIGIAAASGGALAPIGASGIGSILDGGAQIFGQMQESEKAEMIPNASKGNVNTGDVLFSSEQAGFFMHCMSIRPDVAERIDNYFSRFGYKVNKIEVPNLRSRQHFNYIKVGGNDNLFKGAIPSNDLELINERARKGFTIFHNTTNYKNYLVTNPIVSNN